jgi:hypothetical protein
LAGAADSAPSRLAQQQAEHHGSHREAAEQRWQGVRLADVVQHFLGIHQVVDGDEVEAHAELVPEQPFGHGDEQHHEQADGQHALHQPAVCPGAPQRSRAQGQVEAQRQGGIDEEAEVVQRAGEKYREVVTAELVCVSQQQDQSGQQKNAEPGRTQKYEEAPGGGEVHA